MDPFFHVFVEVKLSYNTIPPVRPQKVLVFATYRVNRLLFQVNENTERIATEIDLLLKSKTCLFN